MIQRGGIHWADLGAAGGSRPAKRRPILVVQANAYSASRLKTVLVAVITCNTSIAALPGNVFLPASITGLPRDSAVNVTLVVTLDKKDLTDFVGLLPRYLVHEVDQGLRKVLDL